MNTTRLPAAIALAACSFELKAPAEGNIITLQVTPAGRFTPRDGRELKVPGWNINAAIAAAIVQRFQQKKTPPVVDYEHQTLWKEENGQPAPAAGFFRTLEWREGEGLFAQVELTARAKQYIADGEYRYFSPVFQFHPVTGDVLDLQMGAFTNNPAIDGMQALSERAAATFRLTPDLTPEESLVNPLHQAVLAALGLPQTTTEEQAIAALSVHTHDLASIRKELGLPDSAACSAVVATCTGLKAKAASVDPAAYAPVSVVQGLQSEIAVLTARLGEHDQKDLDTEIKAALDDGRLHTSMEAWARDLGKSNRASLTAYLGAAKPLDALKGSQTRGVPPVMDDKTGLTEDELAVCSAMNLTPEAFKAAKEQ
ncbi:peptidase [Metapseudomonas otitidis]|uniref:Peptidase n=1 Tax=Metapseudomonas otitidis TaxID=319939 RepID=A0A6S5RMS4_9GAMM|nr:phage protease [Pseudomonas otitidis]BBT16233.1 peptidase [Pseudomonas otitidis]